MLEKKHQPLIAAGEGGKPAVVVGALVGREAMHAATYHAASATRTASASIRRAASARSAIDAVLPSMDQRRGEI